MFTPIQLFWCRAIQSYLQRLPMLQFDQRDQDGAAAAHVGLFGLPVDLTFKLRAAVLLQELSYCLDLGRAADPALVYGIDETAELVQLRRRLHGPDQPELFCAPLLIELVPISLEPFICPEMSQ